MPSPTSSLHFGPSRMPAKIRCGPTHRTDHTPARSLQYRGRRRSCATASTTMTSSAMRYATKNGNRGTDSSDLQSHRHALDQGCRSGPTPDRLDGPIERTEEGEPEALSPILVPQRGVSSSVTASSTKRISTVTRRACPRAVVGRGSSPDLRRHPPAPAEPTPPLLPAITRISPGIERVSGAPGRI